MIRILHLSDIQYGRHHLDRNARPPLYEDENYSRQLEKLIEDLEILKTNESVVPNFIAVTGDIAERSLRDEYNAAEEFIGGLADYLKIDRRYVVMVPGNHDINRTKCQALRVWTLKPKASHSNLLISRNSNSTGNFSRAFTNTLRRRINSRKTVCLSISFSRRKAWFFLGLNSCIDESELEPHYGNITVQQLKKATEVDPNGTLLRIALMHHN